MRGCCLLWLKEEALEQSANLPATGIIAADPAAARTSGIIAADPAAARTSGINVADLEAALEQFSAIEEDLKDVLRAIRAAFPDIHWTIEEQIAEADKVVTRFTRTGTHHGPFLGVPATGRKVSVWGTVIDRLEGGKIKETRLIMDALGLMTQLGAFPPA